jgi:hypothetical protein
MEAISPRVYPHLFREAAKYGSIADQETVVNDTAKSLVGCTNVSVWNAPDPQLTIDMVGDPLATVRSHVKNAVDAYNTTTINKVARATEKIKVALLQVVGSTDLSHITHLNNNDQALLGRLMREFLEVDLNTYLPLKGGVSDRWLRMGDPSAPQPENASSNWSPPSVLVYMSDMDPYWWPDFVMQVREENVSNARRKAARIGQMDEFRRLGNAVRGTSFLKWVSTL